VASRPGSAEGPTKWLSDAALLKLIREIHDETKAAYGSPRIYQEPKGRGIPVGKERVERLMRENGLRGRHKRRFKGTTDSKHSLPVAPNRLEQNFATERPDQVWTADITYLATGEGWLYLAVVLDLYTRQIVGWAMRERMTKELVIDALRMAWFRRRPAPGLIHHSDRGSHLSIRYSERQAQIGAQPSVGSVGDSYDNALAETIIGLYKSEVIHRRGPWRGIDEVEYGTLEWVDSFNHRRLLEPIGNIPPAELEATYHQTSGQLPMAA
jgi:transposase InsO family protein